MTLTPTGMTVLAGGGTVGAAGSSAPADVNYARQPSLYIFKVGNDPTGNTLYELTAAGYGGNQSSVSVLQAMVSVGN
jgi:Tfp pilus assembly protein PilX